MIGRKEIKTMRKRNGKLTEKELQRTVDKKKEGLKRHYENIKEKKKKYKEGK